MTALSRKKIGYAPGGMMDQTYLIQDLDEFDARWQQGETAFSELLIDSAELETEARRLNSPELIAKVLLQRSRILLARQHYQKAIVDLTKAEQDLGDARQYDLKAKIIAGLAEAQVQLMDWQAVLATCRRGIDLVEAYRYNVSGQYLQSAYMRSRIVLYTCGVQAAYETNNYPLMLRWADLSKCRSVLRQQSARTLPTKEESQAEEAFSRVCAQINAARADDNRAMLGKLLPKRRALWDLLLIQRAQKKSEKALPEFDIAAVQTKLDPDTAVLYYYWLDHKSLLIVVIDHMAILPLRCTVSSSQRQELEAYTRAILDGLSDKMPGFVDRARHFKSILLPPDITAFLETKQRLIVSPHRLLHALPLHVLPWSEDCRYLIQRFAITYTPNLSSLLIDYRPAAEHALLALGVKEGSVSGYPFSELPEAEMEVEGLRQLYSKNGLSVRALRGADVNQQQLRRLEQSGEMADYTCLHIATHGQNVNSDTPMESFLLLSDSVLEGLEIANWQINAELAVLSACSSGQRPISGRGLGELPGDDLFGLQAAFFAAGIKRVLATLWPVESRVALEIMVEFHRFLIAGQSPDQALQSAITDHIRNAELGFRQSYFWAPFFLSAVGLPDLKDGIK